MKKVLIAIGGIVFTVLVALEVFQGMAFAAEKGESVKSVVDAYTAAWNEPNADARRALLEKAWADDGRYCDPTADVTGRDALVEHISGFQSNPSMKGFSIVVTSGIDAHHNGLRFTWAMNDASGKAVMEGIDFGVLADDGRLQSITGFFGPFPELE